MDRRAFCSSATTCMTLTSLPLAAWSANAKPQAYQRVLLSDDLGKPVKASELQTHTNYVFHYPFEGTPVFLLKLDKAAVPQQLSTRHKTAYDWPGGVGPQRNIVAFSAICAHQLVYPTPQLSFISFRKTKSAKGVQDNLIHCCAEHSQYDPARGARVMNGPAEQPLCAILLEHDPKADTLTAYATLGGELFDEFFKKYEFKLSMDVGPKARQQVAVQSVVKGLDKFCKNPVQC